MRARSAIRAEAALAFGVLIAGCGLSDPYAARQSTSTATTPTVTEAATPRGDDGPRAPATASVGAGSGAPSPQGALERFASLYVNWYAAQLAERARQLATLATGQARAQALALASRATALERYEVTNAGIVTALAPGQRQERGRWAVVTDETTSGTGPYAGLPATSHVTWATVTHSPHGYVITGWYPAS